MISRPPTRQANQERGFYLDTRCRLLLIAIPKCASMSAIKAVKPTGSDLDRGQALILNKMTPTIAIVRHPWDRLISAFYTNLRDSRPLDERISDHIIGRDPITINSHVRPQSFILRGFRIDHLVIFDRLPAAWEEMRTRFPHVGELRHSHKGATRPRWETAFDWNKLRTTYEEDFKLCRDWSG